MIDALLVLNTGSSSLKFQVFARETLDQLMAGKVSGIGSAAVLQADMPGKPALERNLSRSDHECALAEVIDHIDRHDEDWRLTAIVHRVVHGGVEFTHPVVVTPQILERLEALSPLAPLHQPHNIAGIAASSRLAPDALDIACFDTAFHAGRDPLFECFALPREFRDQGIRRYGFHGLSYEWIVRSLQRDHSDLATGKVVVAHLGNGASLCAMSGGRSLDTTMGMTALDGLPMGSRCGALDPGVATHLARRGMGANEIERLLYEESGLKGLSGISNDVAALLASTDQAARFALDYFIFKIAQFTAAMAVSLGGLDVLVFTAGIGENAAGIREGVVERLGFLPSFEKLVIPTNEEKMMAIHARDLLEQAACAG